MEAQGPDMFIKKWLPSPFYESRGNYPLDMIVIHHIGSQGGKLYSVNGTLTWFTDTNVHKNKDTGKIENKVSAHYVLPREPHKGTDIYQLVKDTDIAYHAGESQWIINNKIKKYINRYSVGIEMEGDGNLIEYTDYQYEVLTWIVKELMSAYQIPDSNIVGHEEIAPGRKIDPGKLFDWKKFRSMISPPIIIEVPVQKTPSSEHTPQQKAPEPLPVTSQTEEQFFMEDGSKTYSRFWSTLFNIIRLFFKKFKNS